MHSRMLRMLAVAAIVFSIAASSALSQTPAPISNTELEPAIKLIRHGETESARDALKRIVKKNKMDGEAWYYLGIAYLQLGDLKKASDAFKRAIEVRPDLAAQAHAGYGYALALRNKLDSAALEANKSLAVDPKNVEALYTLGIIDLRKGAKEEALKHAEACIAVDPKFAAGYLLKSQAFVSYVGTAMLASTDPKEERQLKYQSAADALDMYLQLETDARAAQSWQEQLRTLKLLLGDTVVGNEIFVGREVTTKPRLVAKPEPIYTEIARRRSVEGTVVLRCVFAADGSITHMLILEALPAGLTEQSIAAAKQIRFVPATRDGKPVSMWMQLEYNFNLF
jgi:TonB family protein